MANIINRIAHAGFSTLAAAYQGAAVTLGGIALAHLAWRTFVRKADATSPDELRKLVEQYGPKTIEWLKSARNACDDCGSYGYGYMLQDDVWLAAKGSHEGLLCLGCVEKRIGRGLVADDFLDTAPINGPLLHMLRTREPIDVEERARE